jgi:hypothetical protein
MIASLLSEVGAAAVEVVVVTGSVVALVALAYVACERIPALRRAARSFHGDDYVVRRHESPTELYLRRERERRTAWQDVDR